MVVTSILEQMNSHDRQALLALVSDRPMSAEFQTELRRSLARHGWEPSEIEKAVTEVAEIAGGSEQ